MHTREISVGGKKISIETGRLAKQADGSVVVRSGDTVVLVTACSAANAREGIDFLPLTVDYKEYTYASGRIPGGFFKREGKPTEKEVLTSRFIDRPIRPLFASGWRHETQVIALVLSADTDNDSDVLAITGASAALALSSIPFTRTIAGVRVGLLNGEFIINPTFAQRKDSRLDLIVAGPKDAIVKVEAGAKEVSEEEVVQALEKAQAAIKDIVAAIERGRHAEPIALASEERLATESGDGPVIALAESLVRTRALEAGLAYELVAARADLSPVVVAVRRGLDPPPVRTLQGWRRELVGNELLALLSGDRTLSVSAGRVAVASG